jgi:hypothetical protein
VKRYRSDRIQTGILFLAVTLLAFAGGCSEKKELGEKKEDWVKTTPPPQWRGPGQPGGPPAGALAPPPGPPSAAGGTAPK